MAGHQQGLTVRRSTRHEVALPARVAIAPEHAPAVRLTAQAGARDGWVEADVIDFGLGGVGLICPLYFPRKVLLRLQVFEMDGSEPLVDVTVRVQRVVMTDRRPAYMLGTAIEDASGEAERGIERLVARLEGAAPARRIA